MSAEPLDLDAGIVQEAAQRLEAHADYLREGPDGRQPPYYFQSASYDEDIRLVLGVVRQVTRTAPVWDEEAVVEAMAREAYRRLHPARVLTPDSKRTRESDVREMDRAYATWDAGQEGWAHGITCRKIASHLLGVVRECLHDAPAYADRLAAERAG